MAQRRGGAAVAAAAVALLLVSLAVAVQGVDHVVGGATNGWAKPNGNTIPDSYLYDWAKGITFTEGDNLIFNYNPVAHNVLMVSQPDYTLCNTTNPLQKWMSGKDTVKLNAGPSFFICGTPTHCESGQKLFITVVGAPPGSTTPAPSAASGTAVTALKAFVAATAALVATVTLW